MRIMLVNPSSKRILKNSGDRPPLPLLYLGSVLKINGHQVRIRDMDHYSHILLEKEVDEFRPDYVGVSCYTSPVYPEAKELGKRLGGRCKTVVGGYHASALPESLTPYFDIVVIGEGEIALPYIIEHDITRGIIKGEKMNIEAIPFPAREMIDIDNYKFKQDDRPATTLLSSRGCPNACVFCGNMNRQVRFHPIDYVIQEIQYLKRLGYNDLYFYDDNFITDKERTKLLLYNIADEDINYRITTRANTLDEKIVGLLKTTGCSWVSLGIESGVDGRLKDVNKNMTTRDNLNAVRTLHKYNIKVKGFFMFGLPNESLKDAKQTIGFSKILKDEGLTVADFYIMMPFPGTPIWNNPEKYGIEILNRDYTKYLEAGIEKPKAYHRTKFMSSKEIEEMRNLAEEEWKKN